jgi:Cu/Ag efflux protein CusF
MKEHTAKKLIYVTAILALAACAKKETSSSEKIYPMTATIVSRDSAKNTVNLDNKEVPGEMAAMKMDYEVKDAKVTSLPPDGSAVEVTVHDKNGSYSITNVRPKK